MVVPVEKIEELAKRMGISFEKAQELVARGIKNKWKSL